MNKTIVQFIEQQTCANICCVDEQHQPYCFSCYYAFRPETGLLLFKSSPNSHHALLLKNNSNIAGTVLPDKLSKLLVKGIQFEGIVLDMHHALMKDALSHYLKQHPLAIAIPGEISGIQINHIKMTDSTMGFGKKIIWKRMEEMEEVSAP